MIIQDSQVRSHLPATPITKIALVCFDILFLISVFGVLSELLLFFVDSADVGWVFVQELQDILSITRLDTGTRIRFGA